MREINNQPENVFRLNDLVNIEETVFNIKNKKVKMFPDSIIEAGKALLGIDSKAEAEKENKKREEKNNKDLSYFNNIRRITNSPTRKATRLTEFSSVTPYSTSILKTPERNDDDVKSSIFSSIFNANSNHKKKKSRYGNKDNSNLLDDYKYEEVPQFPRMFTILKYTHITTLHNGQCFGDTSLESQDNLRNATCASTSFENVHLGEINIDIYKDYVLSERSKERTKEINFLLDNFFFKGIKKNYFDKKYYSMIIQENYYSGKVIYSENDPSDYLYFIKEGQVELSFNYSMIELHKRIRQLLKFIPELAGLDYSLQNEPIDMIKDLMGKHRQKAFLLDTKECFGVFEVFFGFDRILQAKVSSKTCSVFKINIEVRYYLIY